MDYIIYEETIARLSSAEALAHFASLAQPAPVHQAWFEDQYNNALENDGVVTYPFNSPAVFYQFSKEVEFSGANRKSFTGELTLHIVQAKLGVDGVELYASHASFKTLLRYVTSFIDLLDGHKLPCSARLVLAGNQRDHVNRGLFVDQLRFSFSGSWNKSSV